MNTQIIGAAMIALTALSYVLSTLVRRTDEHEGKKLQTKTSRIMYGAALIAGIYLLIGGAL